MVQGHAKLLPFPFIICSPHLKSFSNNCTTKEGLTGPPSALSEHGTVLMQAYNSFKGLLQKLENPESRAATRVFLDAVDKYVQKEEAGIDCLAKYHFRLHELALCYEGRSFHF